MFQGPESEKRKSMDERGAVVMARFVLKMLVKTQQDFGYEE